MDFKREPINYSPVGFFGQYVEIIFSDDELWDRFLYYVKQAQPNRDDQFYAYHREPECADIWRAMLDNMGGGWPLWLFAAASFLLMRYREAGHDLDAELERIHQWRETVIKCPRCGSRRVAPILYGMPALDEEMEAKLAHKELYLGGCMVDDMDPEYHCFNCNKDICTPPKLLSKNGLEDYRDIVTSIHFRSRDLFDGNDDVLIRKAGNKITVKAYHSEEDEEGILHEGGVGECSISEEKWRSILDELYCNQHLHEWKKHYAGAARRVGDHWELDIRLTDKRVRKYSGDDEQAPYWKELRAVLEPFLRSTEK